MEVGFNFLAPTSAPLSLRWDKFKSLSFSILKIKFRCFERYSDIGFFLISS